MCMTVFTMLKEVIPMPLLNRFVLLSVCSTSRTDEEYHIRCNNDDCHHGKVKFGSLMGALKLVRTSSKLAHFDA